MTSPDLSVSDAWVNHPQGQVFTRSWTPAGELAGVPILLLHDSLGSVELWRNFPAELSAATRRQVIAYDRLGFGKSDVRTESIPLSFIEDEGQHFLPVLLEQLGVGKFIVMGHSVGGGMSVHIAATHPERVVALVTESAQAFSEDKTLNGVALAKEQFKDEMQVARLAKYHGERARWVLRAWTDRWLHPTFNTWTLANVLPRVTCPVLVIHGSEDEYGSTRHPQMIAELSSGPAQLKVIQDAQHVPHRENPELIVQTVAEFIKNLE